MAGFFATAWGSSDHTSYFCIKQAFFYDEFEQRQYVLTAWFRLQIIYLYFYMWTDTQETTRHLKNAFNIRKWHNGKYAEQITLEKIWLTVKT